MSRDNCEPDYNNLARWQEQSQAIPGAAGLAQRPPRTFDQIDEAVRGLEELNKCVVGVLDRLGHQRCESECNDAVAVNRIGPDYSRSLNRLMREVNELRSNIIDLESHI